ncbi:thioesterase II family protein [Streptomyces drozdowiczii]|uniref:Thioesterase domain-containing protein n=1 Tax=Streptomyces drozdowiczii TaxID=202862 RepID=A0ABY6Q1G0_9ACTN|nr:thioesterase domain-containing protein [Streptomyces drozdowiczii]MCX0241593.1 thioesterase domain-containing protein [Streptomyces drozdowiczii]UZK58179.1 thioesterase domain-containing protein [Streptomyces drozdowiczii]
MPDERPVRLHCFAHAGAGVSAFYGWGPRLGPGVETVPHLLPGRERRRSEPRLTRPAGLLADQLPHFTGESGESGEAPYILYGHSLGALVAYSVTRALHEAGLPGPALLVVGACPPPDELSALADQCRAGDEELLRMLGEAGALPTRARPGDFWHQTVLPVLRDDLVLAHELRTAAREPSPAGPLTVPVLAVAGADDPLAQPEAMAQWRAWTTGPFAVRTVPGDHFFLRGHELPRLVGRAARVVRRLAPQPAGVR